MKFIGAAGQMSSGKDTLCDYLCIKLNELGDNWQRTAFAYNVKRVYRETFDRTAEFIEQWKNVPEPPPGFTMNVRKSLQFIGDGFRTIQPTIWLDLVFRDKTRSVIISDCRYVNEFTRVKEEGGLAILIGRSGMMNDDPNGSEAQIRPYVEWALKTFPVDQPFINLHEVDPEILATCPVDISKFDLFVRNDGTVAQLYDIVDNYIVDYVKQYNFNTGA